MFTFFKNVLINLKSKPVDVAKCNFLKGSGNLRTFLPGVTAYPFTTLTCNMASERRVKSICFADYDVIGFDCDHTLAQYNLYNLFKDTYETMAEYLVIKKGYNKEMFKFDPSFCSRGIVLDLETGNFMKLGYDGRILRAFHGTKPLPKTEYEFETWPHHEELSKSMTNIGTRYRIFENFFDMASSLLCAQIIDHLDEKYEGKPYSYDVWPEVVPAIKYVYIPDPYKASNSMFFMRWIKETRRYLEEGSTKLKEWLARMKADGRPMFILSSAYEDFAEATLRFVLGDDWGKYFDFSVFLAEKPRFFYENNPFYHLSSSCEQIIANDLKNCKFIYGGNLRQLQEHLSFLTGKADPKVLYFGDSQRSDIIPSKVYAGWDTVMVLEEMACETCFYKNRVDNLRIEDCQFEDPSIMPWGSVLIDFNETKSGDSKNTGKVQTLVHSVVRKYSDMAVPNLQFLLDYPIDHKFQTFDPNDDCSLSGFHPFIPYPLRR